jgi:hypothetical protein
MLLFSLAGLSISHWWLKSATAGMATTQEFFLYTDP